MKFLKSVEWLYDHLQDPQVKVADCRFSLQDSSAGKQSYMESHIPGAVHFDLEDDLSGAVEKHGGRHPLPDVDELKEKLELAGVKHDSIIIAYDNGGEAFASRFVWILKYMGHEHVYVLDGGFQTWLQAGLPVTDKQTSSVAGSMSIQLKEEMVAGIDEVKKAVGNEAILLVDSRAPSRYRGLEEPLDPKPGRIPGAINKVWTENFNPASNHWMQLDEQLQSFKPIDKQQQIIVYCGSGVTATPTVLSLIEAGFENVKLYSGSYSDWVSYPENNVDKD